MISAELLAKIKAEIERNRQAIRVLNEHTEPEQMSKTCAIFQYSDSILSELLSFLDTIESEKSMQEGLEEELDRFIASGKSVTVDDYGTYKVSYHDFKKVARHFAQWGAEHLKK